MRGMAATCLTFLLLCLCISPTKGFGQSIQSVNPNTTTAGQQVTMVITGSGTNFTTVTGVFLRHSIQSGTVYQGNNFNATTTTNATVDFTIPPNAPLGNYTLSSYGNFNPFSSALNVGVGPGSNYGLVSGKVILDNNGNCVEDVGDVPSNGAVITLTPGPIYLSTDAQGDYSGWVPLGSYNLTTAISSCGSYVCPSNGIRTASVLSPLSTDTGKDFYLQSAACSDLHTVVTANPFRPGFDVNTFVRFMNHGPDPVTSVVGTYILDSNLTYLSSTVPPSQINGDTLIWNYAAMASGFSQVITVRVNVPTTVALGSLLRFSSSLPLIPTDVNLSNNTVTNQTHVVVGSYDPNDKQVWDENGGIADGPIAPGTSSLSYLIRFQNTGTDTAFNIFIRDTLDANLNGGSLRIEDASHPYQFSLTGAGFVQFTFPNILLLDSFSNEPLSHGYIRYGIDLNPGVPLGTTIQNTASIYFDFNVPVVTNTTNSTLCTLLNESFSFTQTGTTLDYAFTDLSDPSANAWLWDFGDGGTSTLQNPTHTYAAAGPYNVCLQVSNSCRTETTCSNLLVVGMKDRLDWDGLRLFPNPSAGRFELDGDFAGMGSLNMQVLDSEGKLLQVREVASSAGHLHALIDLSGEPAGLYLLKLEHNGQVKTLKLQKQ